MKPVEILEWPAYEFPCVVCGQKTTEVCTFCVDVVCKWKAARWGGAYPVNCYDEHRANCTQRKGQT